MEAYEHQVKNANGDGYLDPQKCAQFFGAAAQDLGIKIDLNTEVTGFRIANHKISGVEAGDHFIPAERVIVTGGSIGGYYSIRSAE